MITFLKTLDTAGGKYVEGFCTSDDLENLPIMGICNGSKMEVLTIAAASDDDEGGGGEAKGAVKEAVRVIAPEEEEDAAPTGTIAEYRYNATGGAWVMIGTAEASSDDTEPAEET